MKSEQRTKIVKFDKKTDKIVQCSRIKILEKQIFARKRCVI